MTAYFGISRQAYYKAEKRMEKKALSEQAALELVRKIRRRQPQLGGKKLYYLISEELHQLPVKIGRDAFFKILRSNSLLVRKKRRQYSTTYSKHNKQVYPNLIKELEIIKPNQVLVSDITYIKRKASFSYLSVVSDLYSRKILGYHVCNNLTFEGPLIALKNCLKDIPRTSQAKMIHHSDRGIQYSSHHYTQKLKQNQIKVSMSAKGNPYDNAVMERIMGILKQEFFLNKTYPDSVSIKKAVKEAITIYNEERPHLSLAYKTPDEVYNEKSYGQVA